MKDIRNSIIVTIILIIFVSTGLLSRALDKLQINSKIPQGITEKESKNVVQGDDGETSSEFPTSLQWSLEPDTEDLEEDSGPKIFNISKTTNKEQKELKAKETLMNKEKTNMSELIIFWHGVASVIVGEAAALLIAFAWSKIYNTKGDKNCNCK